MLKKCLAVERKEYRTGEVLAPAERVDVRTALKWYTAGGAYAGFEEKDKSVLAPGRLADLIVLDRDPLTVPAPELKDVKVLATSWGASSCTRTPPWASRADVLP